jgi:hypothetical protein
MTIKGMRTQTSTINPDSFGAWYVGVCDSTPYDHDLDVPLLTIDQQIALCWKMFDDDFDPEDPLGSELLACIIADGEEADRRWDEDRAWDRHNYPEWWELSCFVDERVELEVDEFFVDTELLCAPTLNDRIAAALTESNWSEPSKKRRVDDRRPRYERRDGSPRSKVARSVDKGNNTVLARRDRHGSSRHLVAAIRGRVNFDQIRIGQAGKPGHWDTGNEPQSRQH